MNKNLGNTGEQMLLIEQVIYGDKSEKKYLDSIEKLKRNIGSPWFEENITRARNELEINIDCSDDLIFQYNIFEQYSNYFKDLNDKKINLKIKYKNIEQIKKTFEDCGEFDFSNKWDYLNLLCYIVYNKDFENKEYTRKNMPIKIPTVIEDYEYKELFGNLVVVPHIKMSADFYKLTCEKKEELNKEIYKVLKKFSVIAVPEEIPGKSNNSKANDRNMYVAKLKEKCEKKIIEENLEKDSLTLTKLMYEEFRNSIYDKEIWNITKSSQYINCVGSKKNEMYKEIKQYFVNTCYMGNEQKTLKRAKK